MKRMLIAGICVFLLLTSFSSSGLGEPQTPEKESFPLLSRFTTVLSALREKLSFVLPSNKLTDASQYELPSEYFLFNDNLTSFTGSGTTLYVGGVGPGNYSHIQDAIDHASEGDTIFIYSGVYQENLYIPRSLRLIGEQQDTVIVDGGGNTDTIFIHSDGVILANMTIQHSGNFDAGIKINTNGNRNRIENCTIVGCWDGIEINHGHYNHIFNCNIACNSWSGIYLLDSAHNVIEQCRVYHNADGILMEHSQENVIHYCRIENNQGEGIELEQSSDKNIVYHNAICSNEAYGIFVYWGSDETYISHCHISTNAVGVVVGSVFLGGGNSTTVLSNNITDNLEAGILLLGDGTLSKKTHVHFNNIVHNGVGLLARNINHGIVYAQNNWWGSKRSPSTFGLSTSSQIIWNRVNSHVFFRPWLKSLEAINCYAPPPMPFDCESYAHHSTDTSLNDSFPYQWSTTTLYVGGVGPGNYSHIQDAIDHASEGDTIFIYSGVYQENLYIPRSLRLIGEQQDTVIVDGGGNTDTIFIHSDGVILANMTIQHSGNFDAGIKINTNGNRIENCTIVGCWDGIEINHGHYNHIFNCYIAHSEKEGIYLLYAQHNVVSHADLPYNQESIFLDFSDYNKFTAITAQHNKEEGIQIRDSSHNMFSSCHVSLNTFGYGFYIQRNSDNNIFSACDITKNGVGVFFTSSDTEGPCGTVISFSNVTENTGTGIFFMGNGSHMNDTHIHYNNICKNKKGIMAVNAHDCFIYAQNNWWGRKLGPRFIGLQKSNRIAWKFTDSRIFFHPWLTNPV